MVDFFTKMYEDGGCQRDLAKIDQSMRLDNSDCARNMNVKRFIRDSDHDKNLSQSPPYMGLGQQKRNPDNKQLLSPGHVDFYFERNHWSMGSAQAQKKYIRYNNSLGLGNAQLHFTNKPALTVPYSGAGPLSNGDSFGLCPGRITGTQKHIEVSASLIDKPNTRSNRFLPLQASDAQKEGSDDFYSHKNLGVVGSIRRKNILRDSWPQELNEERTAENNQEDTREWVQ